tara:strand:+ start:4161 stop:4400 length:240 start_codon:yes stop_codon:yes gene_type:complete
MIIKELTTQQLNEELERRGKAKPFPVLLENPDYHSLKESARLYFEEDKLQREIDTQYAYEILMETFYGENYFDWVNSLS